MKALAFGESRLVRQPDGGIREPLLFHQLHDPGGVLRSSGVVGHRHAFRDIDNVFSVGGLNLASPWKIFGRAGKW